MRVLSALACLMWGVACAEVLPELDYVYPAGGRPDSEFEIDVGGVMSDIVFAVFNGEGVTATLVGAPREVSYSKKGKAYYTVVPNRYRFKVTVGKDAKPGIRTFRVGTAYRLSEPLEFDISTLPEMSEVRTNRAGAAETVVDDLPVCLNGRVRGAAPDRYTFQAAKGMTLVALVEARVLPRGNFLPALSFTDAAGKPCQGVSVYDAATAPVAVFEVPEDGRYTLNVASVSGKSANGAVYRIKLGELPLITGFSPMGARAGESLNVRLAGVNLAQSRVRLFTGGKSSQLCLETLAGDAYLLPALRFDLSDEADVGEKEPNDTSEAAQALELPCVVNGELDAPGGRDLYRFSGKKGDALYVDVRAEALGSPLKPRVTVRNSRGGTVASGQFDTNLTVRAAACGRDPSVPLTLPEEGAYEVEVSDLAGRGGEGLVYRLRVGPPQPDYQLWMTPASVNIPSDGSALVTLHLNRIHGFDGEVRAALDFPPLSITCEGGFIPAGATMSQMTVSTESTRYPRTVFGLSLTGSATIAGAEVRHPVLPLVFCQEQGRGLSRRTYGEVSAKVGYGSRALRIDQLAGEVVMVGSRAVTPVGFAKPVPVSTKEPLQLTVLSATMATHLGGLYVPTVVWPPKGFTVSGVQPTNKQERAGVLLKADASVMKSGQTGYLILGCTTKGDAGKKVAAVTQSVPFVIK